MVAAALISGASGTWYLYDRIVVIYRGGPNTSESSPVDTELAVAGDFASSPNVSEHLNIVIHGAYNKLFITEGPAVGASVVRIHGAYERHVFRVHRQAIIYLKLHGAYNTVVFGRRLQVQVNVSDHGPYNRIKQSLFPDWLVTLTFFSFD